MFDLTMKHDMCTYNMMPREWWQEEKVDTTRWWPRNDDIWLQTMDHK